MNAFELVVLGRRITKIGEAAAAASSTSRLPTGIALIVDDVIVHPGASIGEITERTGLPQSHVSESVARLRKLGRFETFADPADGRRTLVRVSADMAARISQRTSAPIEEALAKALGTTDPEAVARIVGMLEALDARLPRLPRATVRSVVER